MSPKRIQRKRTKGWRMPEGAVYVGRPTRWGNPWPWLPVDLSLDLYRSALRGVWNPVRLANLTDREYSLAYDALGRWQRRLGGHPAEVTPSELGGRDLACWCPLDKPCHADLLLEIANGVQP